MTEYNEISFGFPVFKTVVRNLKVSVECSNRPFILEMIGGYRYAHSDALIGYRRYAFYAKNGSSFDVDYIELEGMGNYVTYYGSRLALGYKLNDNFLEVYVVNGHATLTLCILSGVKYSEITRPETIPTSDITWIVRPESI